MSQRLRITGGKVYDPANQRDGLVADICIEGGRVVAELAGDAPTQTIDARGLVVMPGGVEMHAHIASMAVNTTRTIQSATGYEAVVPSNPETGRLYASLGYTTAVEPAVPPGGARAAHMQLDDTPNLDTGLLVLVGNHEGLIARIHTGDRTGAVALIRELIVRSGAYGIKAVNPAAVAAWRRDPAKFHTDTIDDAISGTRVSPRTVLELLTEAQEELKLPHPTHVHGPQLGEPGNVAITLDMLRAVAGRRLHLAHLQYYCYGKTQRGGFVSAVGQLLNHLSDHPQVTADLGMVAFGPAFTATADLPLEHALYRHVAAPGKPAHFYESGNEDCFGVMPLIHTPSSSSHAMQWATGLELALSADNLWQFSLTIDHPNGGSFLNYPSLISLLMSKARRDEQLTTCHRHARDRTGLAALSRELSLSEIAILTRAAPARALGLANKGHLGVGADGDVTIYRDNTADPAAMFASPRFVIKGGRLIVNDGSYTGDTVGARMAWTE